MDSLAETGKTLGVDPILLMCWAFAGLACVVHVILLWWMPPSWVIFFREKGLLVLLMKNQAWIKFVTWIEQKRTTSVVWWRSLFVIYSLWIVIKGPYSIVQRLISNPDTSRLVGMAIVLPVGLAGVLWIPSTNFIDWLREKLPSGWIETPGSSESIVWVTGLIIACLCGSLELLNSVYPPLIKMLLGDVPLHIYHVGILLAAGFACIMTGIEVDGNYDDAVEPQTRYQQTRTYHMAFFSISLCAVVVTYLVLPAVDRKSFLSESMKPMRS